MLSNIAKSVLLKGRLSNKLTPYTVRLVGTESSKETESGSESAEAQVKPIDPAEFKALEEKLKLSESNTADFKDKYIRALAETENVRNRMIKGIDDAKSFGIQGFCKDLLEVADILNLAVVNTNPAKTEKSQTLSPKEVEEKLNSMYSGLVLTEKCLLKIFERNNLVQINPAEGDKFDPNFHDAIFRVPIPDGTSGTIQVVTKTGFKLKDRVIRAAQVGVVQ